MPRSRPRRSRIPCPAPGFRGTDAELPDEDRQILRFEGPVLGGEIGQLLPQFQVPDIGVEQGEVLLRVTGQSRQVAPDPLPHFRPRQCVQTDRAYLRGPERRRQFDEVPGRCDCQPRTPATLGQEDQRGEQVRGTRCVGEEQVAVVDHDRGGDFGEVAEQSLPPVTGAESAFAHGANPRVAHQFGDQVGELAHRIGLREKTFGTDEQKRDSRVEFFENPVEEGRLPRGRHPDDVEQSRGRLPRQHIDSFAQFREPGDEAEFALTDPESQFDPARGGLRPRLRLRVDDRAGLTAADEQARHRPVEKGFAAVLVPVDRQPCQPQRLGHGLACGQRLVEEPRQQPLRPERQHCLHPDHHRAGVPHADVRGRQRSRPRVVVDDALRRARRLTAREHRQPQVRQLLQQQREFLAGQQPSAAVAALQLEPVRIGVTEVVEEMKTAPLHGHSTAEPFDRRTVLDHHPQQTAVDQRLQFRQQTAFLGIQVERGLGVLGTRPQGLDITSRRLSGGSIGACRIG